MRLWAVLVFGKKRREGGRGGGRGGGEAAGPSWFVCGTAQTGLQLGLTVSGFLATKTPYSRYLHSRTPVMTLGDSARASRISQNDDVRRIGQ